MESAAKPSSSNHDSQEDIEALRRERDTLLERQKRVCELIKCAPEKLEHDVRNLINELQLLRTIFQRQEQEESSKQ